MTEQPNQNTNAFTGAGTTTLKTGKGVLGRLTVHTVGTTATIILYDNTAGSGTILYSWATADGKVNLPLEIRFSIGLTVVVTNSPGAIVTWS